MKNRDKQNWLRMWRNDQTDFHQIAVNPLLSRFWGSIAIKQQGRIFVPLCGKSLDLLWLVHQGYDVVGVELSPVAIKAFFEENNLTPEVHRRKNFTVWNHGRVEILCGDFFALDSVDLGPVDVVYDRAALTALSEKVRKLYVKHLRAIVPLGCSIFLLTTEDVCQEGETSPLSPPGEVVDDEIETLYGPYFMIQIVHAETAWESDSTSTGNPAISVIHKVYRLHPKN